MIRPGRLEDVPQLLALGALMHEESRYRVLHFSAERAEATLLAVLGSPLGFLWVADDGREITGGLAALAAPHWCSDDLVSTDLALFVKPQARGGLAAARLVCRYREWALALGVVMPDIGVTTGVGTEETARLFEKLGARRVGIVLEF